MNEIISFCLMWLAVAGFVALIVANVIRQNRRWFKCSYCGRFFSDCGDISNDRPDEATDPLSHGACPDCGEKLKAESERLYGAGQSELQHSNRLEVVHPRALATGSLI